MKLKDIFVAKTGERPVTKAERRIVLLPTHDLIPWAEQCLYGVGRNLNDWSRDVARVELLEEAHQSAEVLLAVVEEIRRRSDI